MLSSEKGKFAVLEGGEGSGKTTLMMRLKDVDAVRSGKLLLTREPGGCEFGEREVRRLLFSEAGKEYNPQTRFHLFFANRADHVGNMIAPLLAQGTHVLSDRFAASTFAHQIFGEGHQHLRKLFADSMEALSEWIVPPYYIYLDIDPEEGIARKVGDTGGNHYDSRGLDYHKRVRQGYEEFFCHTNRVIRIDASQPVETVWQKFLEALEIALA